VLRVEPLDASHLAADDRRRQRRRRPRQRAAQAPADYRRSGGLDLLPRLLLDADGHVDPAVARSLMELRLSLGVDAACRCAERAGPGAAATLTGIVERMRATEDPAELVAADLDFWDAVVDGSDNLAYRLAFNALRRTYAPVADLLHGILAEELAAHDDRAVLAAAVGAGNGPAAEAAARAVLSRGLEAVAALLDRMEETP
jgi:GntR family transcriptional regulator, transcriptional repressor for pyruvate dehydrogenase complex